MAFAPLCRRVCRSGTDFGAIIGRPALLAPLTLPGRTRAAPAERGGRGIRDFPGPMVSPRGTRLMRTTTRNDQPSPAGGRRDALAQPAPPWRSFLLDRARPVFFSARSKRKWGAYCLGQRRFPAPERAHCRRQPGIPRPNGRILWRNTPCPIKFPLSPWAAPRTR